MPRICPTCGTPNRDSAIFCNQCGRQLAASPASSATNVVTVVRPADDPAATLVNRAANGDPRITQPNIPAVSGTISYPAHGTGLLPPDTLIRERYQIIEKLGQGGMAAVYKVKDLEKRGALRAIKEMSQAALKDGEREQAIANFHAEADLLRGLDHPGLPKFYEQFEQEDRYYLVMEFIDGETLESRQEKAGNKPLPEAEVMDWARQLCSVLTYLHERRPPIIFRDLKPGNIMLGKDGKVKLIDFGIARIFRRDKTHDTQVLGTPGYAPPEQYGKGQTDQRSDVYALGVTLHQLLSGYDPSSTPFSLPPIHTLNPNVSPHLQVAIEKATKLKRDERFESISDMASALFAPGAFVFRGGQRASSVAELVALSRQLPLEAQEHLYAGRYEAWLRVIGEKKLAKAAQRIQSKQPNRSQGLQDFLREADTGVSGKSGTVPAGATIPGAATPLGAAAAANASGIAVLEIRPGRLDIGPVNAGQSGVASFTVGGTGGAAVSGEIKSLSPWLHVDHTRFSGPSTLIEVRADTAWLPGAQKHQGTLQISGGGQMIVMPVSIEVVGTVAIPQKGPQARQLQSILKHTAPPLKQPEVVKEAMSAMMGLGLPLAALLITQRVIGFPQLSLLLAGPFFPFLLLAAALLTTLGALVGRWGAGLGGRALTSVICSLATLGIVAFGWANWLQPQALGGALYPEAFLLTAMIACAFMAAIGAVPAVSTALLRFFSWLARKATRLVFALLLFLGGYVGYVSTSGFTLPILHPIGIGVGLLIGGLFAYQVNLYVRRARKQRQAAKP
jgi:serine/threonine protein kinase